MLSVSGTNLGNFILSISLSLLLSGPALSKEKETLTLLTYQDSPLVISTETAVEGIVIEVIRLLMERAEINYKIDFTPPKRAIFKAEHNKNFCVFPISRSQEREATFQWISPILISRHAFYSKKKYGHQLRTMEDAKLLRIGSSLGDGVGEYLEGLGYDVDNTRRNELNADKLELQRIDLWLTDTVSAPYLAAKRGLKLNPPELVFFTTLRSMGCHKDIDPSLINKLKGTLVEMYRDGTIKELYLHYGLSI